jgi:hypothetical protein
MIEGAVLLHQNIDVINALEAGAKGRGTAVDVLLDKLRARLQVPLPEVQAPDQPAKLQLFAGVAVKVTWVF